MKYSLRSLMIVVTLICVGLGGRIEYLRRWAVFHEEQTRWHYDLSTVCHRRQAEEYRKAMLRPWTTVEEQDQIPQWMLNEIKKNPAP